MLLYTQSLCTCIIDYHTPIYPVPMYMYYRLPCSYIPSPYVHVLSQSLYTCIIDYHAPIYPVPIYMYYRLPCSHIPSPYIHVHCIYMYISHRHMYHSSSYMCIPSQERIIKRGGGGDFIMRSCPVHNVTGRQVIIFIAIRFVAPAKLICNNYL